jgi:hypothetical protein
VRRPHPPPYPCPCPVAANATDPVPVPLDVQQALGEGTPTQLYFRGRPNLVAVTAYLGPLGLNASATDIVLSGGSAGATRCVACTG